MANKGTKANNADPDQTLRSPVSDQGLPCLLTYCFFFNEHEKQSPIIIQYELVKWIKIVGSIWYKPQTPYNYCPASQE